MNLPKSVTLFVNLLAASGLFAVSALAQDASKTPAKADVVKGQAIASQACAACHGADGNSVAPANPKLAGQVPENALIHIMALLVTAGVAFAIALQLTRRRLLK